MILGSICIASQISHRNAGSSTENCSNLCKNVHRSWLLRFDCAPSDAFRGVAGVHAPALVERGVQGLPAARTGRVSPGFTPRPWLSGAGRDAPGSRHAGVAGVHAPALVERHLPSAEAERLPQVSPGFTPRPWLSGAAPPRAGRGAHVSPGFTPRPWLSEGGVPGVDARVRGVAGVHAPALVERFTSCLISTHDLHSCRRGSRPGLG